MFCTLKGALDIVKILFKLGILMFQVNKNIIFSQKHHDYLCLKLCRELHQKAAMDINWRYLRNLRGLLKMGKGKSTSGKI